MTQRHIMQFFEYEHLPKHLQPMSAFFYVVAHALDGMTPAQLATEVDLIRRSQAASVLSTLCSEVDRATPPNEEATFAVIKIQDAANEMRARAHNGCLHFGDVEVVLRRLLEAKDCAVRALIAKPVTA